MTHKRQNKKCSYNRFLRLNQSIFSSQFQEDIKTETINWVNSHILELSNTYGVAFEGFEKETIELLMKMDEKKSQLDKKGPGKPVSTPKSRGIGKNELKKLKSSLNEEGEGNRSRGRIR